MLKNIYSTQLVRFLLLSCGLHLLLLGFGKPANSVAPHYLGQPVISVEIQNINHMEHSLTKTTPLSQPVDKQAYQLPSVSRNEKHILDASQSSSLTENSQEHEQQAADASENRIRNQLLGQLQTQLSHHLIYPPLARRRGWEGTVLLGLHIESNGQLEKIYVERSSGYAVLDNSALNALRAMKTLAETTAWLQNRELTMQIPVIYRLRCADSAGCNENP